MDCLCGKLMSCLGQIVSHTHPQTLHWDRSVTGALPIEKDALTLWACPPTGCGRLYLEGMGMGTWFSAEQNERRAVDVFR